MFYFLFVIKKRRRIICDPSPFFLFVLGNSNVVNAITRIISDDGDLQKKRNVPQHSFHGEGIWASAYRATVEGALKACVAINLECLLKIQTVGFFNLQKIALQVKVWTAPNCTDSTKNTPMVENIKI